MKIIAWILPLVLAQAGLGWAQAPYPDGIDVKSRKPGCPCHAHLPSSPGDGMWCPPQDWNPPEGDPLPFVPSPWIPPITITTYVGNPSVTIRTTTIPVVVASGVARNDPPGYRRKAGYLGGGGGSAGGGIEDSDSPLLTGPELGLELKRDVTEWGLLNWLPEGTSLHLYARVLYGELQVFDVTADVQLYSIGPRLLVPIFGAGGLSLGAYLSAGPAFLRTEIGDATGAEGGVGLRAEYILWKNLSLVGGTELTAYTSDDVFSWGPAATFGFNLKW